MSLPLSCDNVNPLPTASWSLRNLVVLVVSLPEEGFRAAATKNCSLCTGLVHSRKRTEHFRSTPREARIGEFRKRRDNGNLARPGTSLGFKSLPTAGEPAKFPDSTLESVLPPWTTAAWRQDILLQRMVIAIFPVATS